MSNATEKLEDLAVALEEKGNHKAAAKCREAIDIDAMPEFRELAAAVTEEGSVVGTILLANLIG